MSRWLATLDDLLRGRSTGPAQLSGNAEGLGLRLLVTMAVTLGAVYGVSMGVFAATGRDPAEYHQLLASAVKFPAVFLLTLAVTFPSLYVFSALGGCSMRFLAVLRVLVATVVVNAAVSASLAPILAFFTFSTTSYPFMIVLNVVLLTIAGAVALGFLLRTLRRLSAEAPDEGSTAEGRLSSTGIFNVWVVIYALVGAQMGWLLRPFVGNPTMPFEWLRPRAGNFFHAVFDHLRTLFS